MLHDVAAMSFGSAEPQRLKRAESLGLAFLGRTVFEGAALEPVWEALRERCLADGEDAGALLDLSTLVQMRGERDKGLELQAAAIAMCRFYRTVHGTGAGPKILIFMAPGDLMTNTPVDFLLEGSDAEVTVCYVTDGLPDPAAVPEHDVAFLAISQSDDGSVALAKVRGGFDAWPRPVVNGRPGLIAALSRDGVAERFAGHPQVLCPVTARVDRMDLVGVAAGIQPITTLHPDLAFPIIVRPIGSHAGNGLEKIETRSDLAAYLQSQTANAYFVAAFHDYAGSDGRYRKLRVVFIKGEAFLAHMAVSERWMVHYLNADMDEAANRAEEAQMMVTFEEGFAARHAQAFEALVRTFGLDYFGIDCAETPDGRLLVFEADVAMIVHALDSAEIYPYKKPAMARLFRAFLDAMSPSTAHRRRLAA